jgi:hypothetical protein
VEDFLQKLETHLFETNQTYLTESFSSADVCVAIWLAQTMQKCQLTKLPQQPFRWIMTVLHSIQSYGKGVALLIEGLEEGAPSPETNPKAKSAASAPAAPGKAVATPEKVTKPSNFRFKSATKKVIFNIAEKKRVAFAAAGLEKVEFAPAAVVAAASVDFAENALLQKLQEFGLEHFVYEHDVCMADDELVASVVLASPKETHTKNILLRDEKHGNFLVTHAASRTFDTKQLGALLKLQGEVDLRVADEALLEKFLKVKTGCVGPLCIVNDTEKEVTLVLDQALMGYDYIHSHPLRNDASVKLTPAALKEFMKKAGIEPVILDFSTEGGVYDDEKKTVAFAAAGLDKVKSAPAAAVAAASGDVAENVLLQKLQEFGLEHFVYEHDVCMTADELVANVPLASPKETHTKNLLLRDKKHGNFLVTHATSTTFNTKQLGALLKLQGKVNLRLADEALLEKFLKVKTGCVGPLCVVNDTEKEVTLVLDQALMGYDYIHSHPLRNDASVKLTPAVLKEYMKKAGIEPVILDFSTEGGDSAGAGGKAPANRPPAVKSPKDKKPEKQDQGPKKQAGGNKKSSKKGETLLALQWKKDENFPGWYSDVIVLSEMISYYDISGCYILRPWSYKIWELIQEWFNAEVRPPRCI